MASGTNFEQQYKKIRQMYCLTPEYEPTVQDFLQIALGYDPSQDGLYLCQKCGVTWDHECSYGGWHNLEQAIHVSVEWMS